MAGLSVRAFASGEAFSDACGLEVRQALLARQADLPVVFISGHAGEGTVRHAIQTGAVDFLTKPLRSGELPSGIRRCLAIGTNGEQGMNEPTGPRLRQFVIRRLVHGPATEGHKPRPGRNLEQVGPRASLDGDALRLFR